MKFGVRLRKEESREIRSFRKIDIFYLGSRILYLRVIIGSTLSWRAILGLFDPFKIQIIALSTRWRLSLKTLRIDTSGSNLSQLILNLEYFSWVYRNDKQL